MTDAIVSKDSTLEAVLSHLALYGRPMIQLMSGGGWFCCNDMKVSGTGVSFEIKSNFDHSTPTDSALCCLDRMNSALKGLRNETPVAIP